MVSNSQKEYCANIIASIVIEKLCHLFPSCDKAEIITSFVMSKTYEDLYKYNLEYWTEGPDSILENYIEETNNRSYIIK